MSKPKPEPSQTPDAPEAKELSDDALESVAGGCQIGQSVGDPLQRTTYEPPITILETLKDDQLF